MRRFRAPKGLKQRFALHGIALVTVRSVDQLTAVGIHLSNPKDWELDNALEDATKDMFPAVYVHDDLSWELRRDHMRAVRARREGMSVVAGNDWALRTEPRGQLAVVEGGAA